jgi:hypothetical protein
MMWKMLVLVGFLLPATVVAQQPDNSGPKGTIYGVVMGQDGRPAKGIGLTAQPLEGALAGRLPHTKTNDAGEYRFENLTWWGKYTVYAEDDEAGYSLFSTGWAGSSTPTEVEITPEHPKAEFLLYLPPQAGFLKIKLTNLMTGDAISAMRVELRHAYEQKSLAFTMSCYSTHVVLVPPDQDVLLHVSAEGFREWEQSVGEGKAIRLASGAQLKLEVQLVPLKTE